MKKLACICFFIISMVQFSGAQIVVSHNRVCYQSGSSNYNNTAHLVTDGHEDTFWQSRPMENEWIYTNLGILTEVSSLKIIWGDEYATKFRVEISSDNTDQVKNWTVLSKGIKKDSEIDFIKFKKQKIRFVKIVCESRSSKNGCIVKELQVFGDKAKAVAIKPQARMDTNGDLFLTGGNWKLQRQSYVSVSGEILSKDTYNDSDWIPATVPGTVLTSYLNIGAIPEHNFGDQQLMISDSFFTSNFWYRNTFEVPTEYKDKEVFLNFKGINWKADIFFNGIKIGRINGAYIQTKFNLTKLVKIGKENSLAVLIYKNDNPGDVTEQHLGDPGPNGGIIGLDSPTILASIGWNWMPTVRGRNCGIWNDVFLSQVQNVSIVDPIIVTDLNLPDTTNAYLSLKVGLTNHKGIALDGILKGEIGDIKFEKKVHLNADDVTNIELNSTEFPQFHIKNPKLWWPNGYGNQDLYHLNLKFFNNDKLSDQKTITFGIRKYTYTNVAKNLQLNINGVPIVVRGGNWGMPEALLRCDSAGYDLRVRLHKEMNLNMIRNWIGMIGHDAFYEACDKYGIMIWDDFWLANPVDGPIPTDSMMFMSNVNNKIALRRNHASLAIWCGRNEGYPPANLDSAMKASSAKLDGTRFYVSSSAHQPVTGLGPYETKDPIWYFKERGSTFHTEQGIVCVPSIESMREMMPETNLWPINDMWGKHDWTQKRVNIYAEDLKRSYGEATDLADFCRKSQMMNMEGPKAMMETWQSKRGPGVIVWMTHSAWPSLICQTYDYYFEPTAAFFAFKTASEPVHILWRADNQKIQISNNTLFCLNKTKSHIKLYDFNGKLVFETSIEKDIPSNAVVDIQELKIPSTITNVFFIDLELFDNNQHIISRNFYWSATNYQDYRSLNEISKAKIKTEAQISTNKEKTFVHIKIHNSSDQTALMLRLKVLQSKTNKRVLPAIFSDNYISIVPKQSREIKIEFESKNLDGDLPKIMIEGWNIQTQEIKTP